MNMVKWILLTYYGLSSLVVIGSIGKPRGPLTPGVAVATICLVGVIATLVVFA